MVGKRIFVCIVLDNGRTVTVAAHRKAISFAKESVSGSRAAFGYETFAEYDFAVRLRVVNVHARDFLDAGSGGKPLCRAVRLATHQHRLDCVVAVVFVLDYVQTLVVYHYKRFDFVHVLTYVGQHTVDSRFGVTHVQFVEWDKHCNAVREVHCVIVTADSYRQ